jgi:D-glycero-alpha-D-manno-heptose-7-phosphate kinase
MLMARAPVRVSFFGGGTDLPAYYSQYPGAVLSTTINRYVYVVISVNDGEGLQITSSDYRTFYRHNPGEPLLWDGDLSLPRAVLAQFGVERGLAMFLASEVPPGTGLGSSSAVTVAMVKAISTACGQRLTRAEVAELACDIEIDKLRKPIGKQDQYASAFGGFNWISFTPQQVTVERLPVSQDILDRLQSNLILAFTGTAHDSARILVNQSDASREGNPTVIRALHGAHELALEARELLLAGKLHRFGELLDLAWQHKRQFAPGISNPWIENWYSMARRAGALGGKVAGAGGGGFMMLYCDDGMAPAVEATLTSQGLRCLEFRFEPDGARVLLNAGLRLQAEPAIA